MEWLEQLKANSPYITILGGGLVVVWRAFSAKDAALTAAKDETIRVLLDVVKSSSKS